MRSLFTAWAALASLCLPVLAQDAVVVRQDSDIRIVEMGDFGNASGWLSEMLERYLLTALQRKSLAGAGPRVTFILEARAAEWSQLPREAVRDIADLDAFEVEITPDPRPLARVTGATALSAGFGVAWFLENCLGVTWLFPGDLGTCVPRKAEFALPAMNKRVAPFMASRLCTGFAYRDPAIPAKRFVYEGLLHRHSLFFYSYDYFKSARLHGLASPSHNMINIITPAMKDTEPDVFPMRDGKRWFPPPQGDEVGRWQAWHPCYTNPRTVEIAVEKAREALGGQTFCFSLGINDGRRYQCECPECKRVGFPRSYYNFVTQVAQQVKEFYPPRVVGLIAYGDVAIPPEDLRLPENVLVMVAGGGERLRLWRTRAHLLGAYEYAHGAGYWVPNMPLKALESNARFYRDAGIRFFRAEMHPLWAFDAPRHFIHLRLLWDPGLDADALLRRFCEAGYGKGAAAMLRMYRRWGELWGGRVVEGGVSALDPGEWPFNHWRNVLMQLHGRSTEDFAFSLACLDEAAKAAPEGLEAGRIEMVRTFMDDSYTLYQMSHLADRMTDAGVDARDLLPEARRLLASRQAGLEKMRAHPEWFAGTSEKIGDDLRPSWEGRELMIVPRALSNAIQAHTAGVTQGATMKVHAYKEHAWYPDWGYLPLETSQEGAALRFKTPARTDQLITEHESLAGRRKPLWLSAFVTKAAVADGAAYAVDIECEGRRGFLYGSIDFGANNTSRSEGFVLRDFGDDPQPLRKRLLIPASFVDRATLDPVPAPAGAEGIVFINLRWLPRDDESTLDGLCRAVRLAARRDSATGTAGGGGR
ncbi:MAG TPA: DUF4838 domain-containing protein [Candidatus Brocadiia bacterium]|nr:DUF4838 domain-containing protein [Candidatus Brocadiia bacterium]